MGPALMRDMRPLPLAVLMGWVLLAAGSVQAAQWQFASEVIWQDNATNAERPQDLLSGWQWRTELQAAGQWLLGDGHRLRATAGANTELWPRFPGLGLFGLEIAAAWEFKPGFGPHRPVFEAGIEGGWTGARERDRSGSGGAGHVQVRQRAGSAWLFTAGHEWRRFDARGRAFDRTAKEWSGRVEWTFAEGWTLAATGRRRVGDVVSYSRPPRPDLVALGKPISFVDTFEQATPWIAYYFAAETRSGSLELLRSFGRSVVGLSYEYRHTLHAGPGYNNQRTALRYGRSF